MLEIQQCTQGLSYVSVYKQCFIKKVYLQQQKKKDKTKQNTKKTLIMFKSFNTRKKIK